jgi:excisionase family DNA binding protein
MDDERKFVYPMRPPIQTRAPGEKMETTTLLKISNAAERLGISMPTARRWVASGKLPVKRLSPRTLRITEYDLEAFISSSNLPVQGKA